MSFPSGSKMGKRSTTSTKSGKFMNPTDQARKEARRKELKKNKKQRMAVRAAVLKNKNPRDIVVELEKIDDMEFNAMAPPPLNDKVGTAMLQGSRNDDQLIFPFSRS